ncbi:MAG: hypothetical protein IKP15_07495 [Bacteroidales bacterium]|nr:hypothetical protein [Bacteroidales bacterium]
MTELEKYIRENAAAFDTESPAEGHEARFRARLFLTSFRAAIRNLRPAPVLAFAVAACAALLLIIRPGDPFRGVAHDPEAIYLAYMDRVADLYQALPMEDEALQEITEETEPLFTQLPENLSNRERSRILRNHYGELLAAARQLKKQ